MVAEREVAEIRLDAARARGNPVEIAGAEQGLTQAQDRSRILRASISPIFAFEGSYFDGV